MPFLAFPDSYFFLVIEQMHKLLGEVGLNVHGLHKIGTYSKFVPITEAGGLRKSTSFSHGLRPLFMRIIKTITLRFMFVFLISRQLALMQDKRRNGTN